jgi:DNA-binding CsgD family transcriptional regulator
MIVHQTSHLKIFLDHAHDLFIVSWIQSPENATIFKREMLLFKEQHQHYKVSKALWLHENFEFVMDTTINDWTETHIVHPCFELGVQKFAFVISKDVFSHLSVIESFDGLDMPSFPKHFTSKEEALEWMLNDTPLKPSKNNPTKLIYDGLDSDGHPILKFKTGGDVESILRKLKSFKTHDQQQAHTLQRFQTLSKRERQILLRYMNGQDVKKMADELNISIHTVRTHWRNIKQKLNIHNAVEASEFRSFY